ncbi:hypothetical protein BI050_gp34 [Pectobacterium phage PP90]|uniref:Uncharacterized protein n=1 Tax=Pectobacterium phage PP90 TaxID=1873959 RepID=A0A1B1PEJ1_9CAUD|nr:hypothetical protein BI050_gp34 [Pectobacterium phage PP90]ANT45391.1 hypothetical protein BI050_gp34 [Pectobacterium phage PP90]
MYSVRYYPNGNTELLLEVASGLYDTYEYPRKEFNKLEYLQKVLLAASEDAAWYCFLGDKVIGAITVSDEMYDVHFNGTGRHVTNCVILPGVDSRKALKLLLGVLRGNLKEGVCSWYSTTHRKDFNTLITRYTKI